MSRYSIEVARTQAISMLQTVLICSTTVFIVHAHSVFASSGNGLKVSPAFLEINTNVRDESVQYPITYSNTSSETITVSLSFLPVTFSNNTMKLGNAEARSILATHLIPSTDSFSIAPNEVKNIILSPSNLQLLADGDFNEALVARISTGEMTQKQGTSIVGSITTLLIARNTESDQHPNYVIEKPDHILPAVLTDIPQSLSFTVRNTGNTYGTPRGRVEMRDMFGRTVLSGILNEDSTRIFPGTRRSIHAMLYIDRTPFPIYFGRLRVNMRDGYSQLADTGVELTQEYLYVDPLFSLTSMVFGVVCLLYVASIKKKRNRLSASSPRTKA